MVTHAAFGGSTNLISPAGDRARRRTSTLDLRDWTDVNRKVPRIVDAPERTAASSDDQVFQAGGVPEVMLHLRRAGLLPRMR